MKSPPRPSAPSLRTSATPLPNFMGSWLVTEYVYNEDGSFAGVVHQRRTLHRLENGRIRVTQVCEPEAALRGHAMAAFAGEWVFELAVDGKRRHYLGKDVVGMGIQYVDGIMTGKGRWPRFGPEFVSFGFLTAADQQITGGLFHHNGCFVANIIGTATQDSVSWPEIEMLSAEINMKKQADSLATIVGEPTYKVWVQMLSELVPEGRTHRLALLVAGMLQYAAQVAEVDEDSDDPLAHAFTTMYEAYDAGSVPKVIYRSAEQLFFDANVAYDRHSSRGTHYSILEEALEEFVRWHDMPWEY